MEVNDDVLQEVRHGHLDIMFDELLTTSQAYFGSYDRYVITDEFSNLFGFNPILLYSKKHAKVNYIMGSFDFIRCQQVMHSINWRWAGSNTPPSIDRLQHPARRLLVDLLDHPEWTYVGTGGFKASANRFGDLTLEFIVSSWDTEGMAGIGW